jgi:hypothetical protein
MRLEDFEKRFEIIENFLIKNEDKIISYKENMDEKYFKLLSLSGHKQPVYKECRQLIDDNFFHNIRKEIRSLNKEIESLKKDFYENEYIKKIKAWNIFAFLMNKMVNILYMIAGCIIGLLIGILFNAIFWILLYAIIKEQGKINDIIIYIGVIFVLIVCFCLSILYGLSLFSLNKDNLVYINKFSPFKKRDLNYYLDNK